MSYLNSRKQQVRLRTQKRLFCANFSGELVCCLLLPQLPSTHGPQTPPDMWSLPQDVTIATDPLGLRDSSPPFSLLSSAQLSSAVGGAAQAGMGAVIPSASLTSGMALQGYGDDLAGPDE